MMFTSFDKALAGLILGGLGFASYMGWLPFEVTPELQAKITAICSALTPFVVWLVPNKPKA